MAPDESGNIGTWNVWIEEAERGLQLIAEGELAATSAEANAQLLKADPQGSDERDLLLTIVPRVPLQERGNTLKLTYSEPLRDEHQYASITVTNQGAPVARIVDIGRKQPV